MHVFAAMGELHREVSLVGTLVGRKARVAVNAEQRPASRPRIRYQMGRDVVEHGRKVGDKSNGRLMSLRQVFVSVRLEPLAIVIALQALEEMEELGSEVWRHGDKVRVNDLESKADIMTLRTALDLKKRQPQGA